MNMAPIAISPSDSPKAQAVQPADIPDVYQSYAYVHWYVGNAKQAASYYISRMGFERIAFKGLETGSRVAASHVVSNGKVIFVLTSPLRNAQGRTDLTIEEKALLEEIHGHQEKHGDAVKGECCLK